MYCLSELHQAALVCLVATTFRFYIPNIGQRNILYINMITTLCNYLPVLFCSKYM